MPAEWERHEGTWLAWPKDPLTFPEEIVGRVEEAYRSMVVGLNPGERVDLLVDDEAMERRVSAFLGGHPNVSYHTIRTADVWMRDYGPIFVREPDGTLVAVKWIFNAWGNKYDELLADNRAGMEVARISGVEVLEPGIVLEGGSIDANGRGTCLTTEQCLLNRNRNPQLTKEQIQGYLTRFLGFTNFVWLKEGIAGDDTDGHVDDIARFVGERRVICMVEEDPRDENFEALKENLAVLRAARDERGRNLEVIPISMPRKKVGGEERLPASYANFYVGNSAVLVPTFDDVNDRPALEKIAAEFPGRKVVG
ncbi:MAG: agmatine deiminase family protein, partial [Thaumarchaeota archaeon]|nr:agmatine deiminase family protein [Nitrososphaerota archaeon]